MQLLPPSEEQRRTVFDVPTLVGHNSTDSWSYALALYFSLLVVLEMALVCCSSLMFYIESLAVKLAVMMLFPALASVGSLCSLKSLEKLEIVLAGVRVAAMLLGATWILTRDRNDITAEEQFAFLSVTLWLLNYHVCTPLFLPSQPPDSQKQIHNTTLAISAGFCIALVFMSYWSTNLAGVTTYQTLFLYLFPIVLLSTSNTYLRMFSHMLCTWRYGCNPIEIETRYSKSVKLIKIIVPWPVFLIYALVEIIYFGKTFRRFYLSFIINGPIATIVLYWILAHIYEKQRSQLGLQNRALSKWATGALKWIPALIMTFGVTEMALLPGFKMSYFIQPRLMMPLGVDLVLFGALVLWKQLGDR